MESPPSSVSGTLRGRSGDTPAAAPASLSPAIATGTLLFAGSQLEILQSQVCRSQDEGLTTGEQWKAAMIDKGWT